VAAELDAERFLANSRALGASLATLEELMGRGQLPPADLVAGIAEGAQRAASYIQVRPPERLEAVVNLIGSRTTAAGLRIRAGLDRNHYDKGLTVTREEMAAINLRAARILDHWNYVITPRARG
jgi:hypothetical protein